MYEKKTFEFSYKNVTTKVSIKKNRYASEHDVSQWTKLPKKQSVGECIFDNMALYFECRINVHIPFTHEHNVFILTSVIKY